MSSCCDKYFNNAQNGCPCDQFVHPEKLKIHAGLSHIPRQIATFPDFRRAMLAGINDKLALFYWHPKDQDDLGVMLLEMWAYICDSLSFYDEIIAHESYLRTARRRPSLRKLVALLGYLPKPAVGASVFLSAFADGRQEVELPEGTAFRSGAFEDEPPQVFELEQSTIIHPFTNNWPVQPIYPEKIAENNPSFLLIEPQIELEEGSIVFIENTNKKKQNQALPVQSIETYTGKDNESYTKINFESQLNLTTKTQLSNLKLYTPTQSVSLWTLGSDHLSVSTNKKHLVLDALYHDIKPGDHVIVALNNEYRWFLITNVEDVLRPASSENSIVINNVEYEIAGIEVPVTEITLDAGLNNANRPSSTDEWSNSDRDSIVAYYGMVKAGKVVDEPNATLSNTDELLLDGTVEEPIDSFIPGAFILEDKNQEAVKISGSLDYDTKEILYSGDNWDDSLYTPVEAYGNIIEASRGETVNGEILGNGDASIANQTFKLKKKPLTYFLSSNTNNSQGVANTVSIYVDNILWQEVEFFYGKTENDTVYIVRQDDDGETFITFGDGIRGKRLPSGISNIVANYRYGAGSASPPAGSITQVAKPVKGLKSIKNHIAASGGADADEESEIREHGPDSVLIMNRAVSIKDMEAVVLSVPGLRNAQVEWRWHGDKQNTMVHVYYVGEAGIESSISEMLHDLSDPTTLFNVELAEGSEADLAIDVKISQDYDENSVLEEIQDQLFNTTTGILIPENVSIGGPLFRSSIFKSIHEVQGVLSVRNISINGNFFYKTALSPGAGKYFDFENGNFELSSYSDYE
ncbi:MAG: hypothetical protein K8R63_13535 [Bacteroidales bacterium]|nr:hypothetical protein [Bacteroidales bacterium]